MTTPTTSNTPPIFLASPFPHPDLGQVVSQSFAVQDIAQCALVNKAWEKAMNAPGVWLAMFDKEKFPRIKNREAEAKEDFKFMRKITISKRDATCFGEFVGEAPIMSEKTFSRLKYEKDAFDPAKYNDETHVVIVEPTHFLKPYDPDLSKRLLDNGDFGPDNIIDKKTMMIPNSTKNLIILAEEYSTKNLIILAEEYWGEDEKLFDEYTLNNLPEILKECNKVSKMVNVYVLRIDSPKITENKKYTHQRQILEKRGYEVAPFRPRFYFNMLQLFKEGTCPDKNYSSSTSDLVRLVDLDESAWVGEDLFSIYTVRMGTPDCPEAAFPMISCFPADHCDEKEEDTRAAAVFSAEAAVVKETPAGSKRTHDEAFGE